MSQVAPVTEPARSPAAVDDADALEPSSVLPLVDAVPRLAAFVLVGLGLVGTPLLLAGRFDRLPVLAGVALVVLLLELAWRRRAPARGPLSRRALAVSVLALLVVAVSTSANARWSTQHLLVDGDPAVYAVTGQLIAETGQLDVPTRSEDLFGGVDSLAYAGAGFDAYDDETVVRPSFMHLLPMALALASWLGGAQALLWANAVLSGCALLAVFAFGTRLTRRPEWALVATTALALSLPQQHFSRDTFSEIPAQLLVFAGLALLHDAVRYRASRLLPALVAGLVLGVSCTARIDAYSYLVPVVLLVTVLVFAGAARAAAGLLGGVLLGAVMGYVDLRVGSRAYLGLQEENLHLIFAAVAATTVLCGLALALRSRVSALWPRLRGRALSLSAVAVLGLLAVYAGVVRPQVETGRNLSPAQPTAVASLQEAAGRAVDPLRSYDELSLQWLSWYLGPAAIVLGVLGLCLLVRRTLARPQGPRDAQVVLAALGFVLLLGASTALYLWRPSIIPVQYWATRRFLPVTIPGLLLCAAFVATVPRRRWAQAVTGTAVALSLLVPPLLFLRGHATEREYVPMLAVTEQLCEVLQPDDAVLLLGGTRLATALPQTIHAFCGVPVAAIGRDTTPADVAVVAAAARAAGKRPVMLSPVEAPFVAAGGIPGDYRKVVDETVSVVALTIFGRPTERFSFPMTIYLAVAP